MASSSASSQEEQTSEASDHGSAVNYTVMIVASAPFGTGLVHAVTVTQPAQSWTVIRGQDDFVAIGNALSGALSGLPPCPQRDASESTAEVSSLIIARNDLQQWLNELLMHESVRGSNAIVNFLTYAANMIPPQFEGIPWTSFAPDGSVLSTSHPYGSPAQTTVTATQNLDDMEMDEMFVGEDEYVESTGLNDVDDDDEFHRPMDRYTPIDEEVTMEDEADFLRMASEVEMVEDVGSLAQSMGARNLGKSLQLQAEMGAMRQMQQQQQHDQEQHHHQQQQRNGLLERATSSSSANDTSGGGIGSAMQNAVSSKNEQTTSTAGTPSFASTRPTSAPRLDSFKLISVIGKGSFGKVFLVKEIETSNVYALKVLKKDNVIKRNQVEHTRTERSVLGYVKHPFIVGMNMAFQSSTKLFFVLDYCPGGELFSHLQRVGKFSESRARFYTAEILLAISYVHSLDIIYRDLKPENVLLDAQGHIRLTDFGLSKEGVTSSSSGAFSFCGTPEYLSPEIVDRKGHGFAVDWWSLGALLYEMLTSLPPFYCENRERLFENIRRRELQYPGSLSSSARSLLKGLLMKDPNRRLGSGPTDAEEIKQHEFFNPINWDKLKAREIQPPWVPQISSNQDTSQFDAEFTNLPFNSPHSLQRSRLAMTPQSANPFEGFTWTDRGVTLAKQAQLG